MRRHFYIIQNNLKQYCTFSDDFETYLEDIKSSPSFDVTLNKKISFNKIIYILIYYLRWSD